MKQDKILIVDDQPAELDMMKDILDCDRYTIVAVGSGEEALQIANEGFDLLLTDIVMPHMEGLELIKEFQEVSPDAVTILVTAYAGIETARAAMQYGAYDYIVKPFDQNELRNAVAKALERKKLADENLRLKDLVGLYKVSQSMAKSSGGSILLFDSLKRGLVIATSAGSWEIVARFSNALLESGIWYGIKDMEEAVLFTDVEQHPLFERVSQHYSSRQCLSREAGSVEILLQPIRSGTEVLGLLNVFRERAPGLFVDADLELLTILAAQSGALIKSRQLFAELEDGSFDVLCSLASWVDNRSLYTQGHMKKVAELSEQLASAISLSEAEMKAIKQGAMVHDIGMIGVSDSILNKPGDLSPQEWDIVKFHPVIGEEIISPLGFMSEARYIVKHHHERLDSSGYPDALSGKQITSL
jgi:putative nucleotidyltransferase with HDIG domain